MSRSVMASLVALVAAIGLLGLRMSASDRPTDLLSEPSYGDFEVQTSSGALSLSDFRGRPVVVYFGYTACPDICPTTLASLGAAFQKLAPDTMAATLFVSVDPGRDSPEQLSAYIRYFDPRFRAGTTDPAALRAIAEDWGVYYRKAEDTESAFGYAVDHSTDAFLVAPDGTLVKRLPHGLPATEIAAAIEALGPPGSTRNERSGP